MSGRVMFFSLIALVLTGCEPPKDRPTAQGDTQTYYYYNGTVDGCRLYRIVPHHGDSFHLAVCSGGNSVSNTFYTGTPKNRTRREFVTATFAAEGVQP